MSDPFKVAARQLAAELQTKIDGTQGGVGTFADHVLVGLIAKLDHLDEMRPWEDSVAHLSGSIEELKLGLQRLQLLVSRRGQGRFVEFQERSQALPGGMHGGCDLGYFDLVMSQGVLDCMQWKGMPLFKTVYDFSIYAMLLWALKPRTIIELGCGTGASAVWLADLMTMFGIDGRVYSVDVKKPVLSHDRVSFIEGDCLAITTVFTDDFLKSAAHPWVIIEDAHVNVYGVLHHFHDHVKPGDYVVIEDSAGKQDDIGKFLAGQPGCYKVDTHYTDFYGRNVTCAQDSILVRV